MKHNIRILSNAFISPNIWLTLLCTFTHTTHLMYANSYNANVAATTICSGNIALKGKNKHQNAFLSQTQAMKHYITPHTCIHSHTYAHTRTHTHIHAYTDTDASTHNILHRKFQCRS